MPTTNEIMEFTRGWHAAGKGEPFDVHETIEWRDGWDFWHSNHRMIAAEYAPNVATVH